ncbi:MAG: fumarylacetoacetate hydrolase family protein [candidate division Zixibacteria bacterium]|nr:fumarylacetoacetate hydrolase family protein [candidate division Zixibacteria bacterium]
MSEKYVRYRGPIADTEFWGHLSDDDLVSRLTDAPWLGGVSAKEQVALSDVTLLAPVQPSKIVCIGLNYHAHVQASYSADEAPERPLIFLKPSSSVIGPGEAIVHTNQSERVDYEAELGVVIGKTAKNVPEDNAMDYVFGFTCVNDVTARDLQKKDGQWSRAKGFDTFCPVGPWIVTELDWQDALVEGIHNDEVKQSGRTSLMIFNLPYLISYISSIMTLNPGDLISTGTPSGIAPMKPGDSIRVRVAGIGTLENHVVESAV